jgi:hypothetical protein
MNNGKRPNQSDIRSFLARLGQTRQTAERKDARLAMRASCGIFRASRIAQSALGETRVMPLKLSYLSSLKPAFY